MTTSATPATAKSAEEFHVVATPGTDYACDVSTGRTFKITPTTDIELQVTGFEAGLEFFIDLDPDGNAITFNGSDFDWINGAPPYMPSGGQRIIISGVCTATVAVASWAITGEAPVLQSWQTLVETATVIAFDGASGINAKIAEADVDSANTLDVPDNIADGQTGSILVQGGASVSWFGLNSAWKLGKTAAGASRALSDTTLPSGNTDAVLLTYQRLGSTYLLLPCDNTFYPWS